MSNTNAENKEAQALVQSIKKRLIETGDWDRISKALDVQLEESGWKDDVKDLAKEKARGQENLNLQALLASILDPAKGMLRQDVRNAVTQEIEAALEREVEQA